MTERMPCHITDGPQFEDDPLDIDYDDGEDVQEYRELRELEIAEELNTELLRIARLRI